MTAEALAPPPPIDTGTADGTPVESSTPIWYGQALGNETPVPPDSRPVSRSTGAASRVAQRVSNRISALIRPGSAARRSGATSPAAGAAERQAPPRLSEEEDVPYDDTFDLYMDDNSDADHDAMPMRKLSGEDDFEMTSTLQSPDRDKEFESSEEPDIIASYSDEPPSNSSGVHVSHAYPWRATQFGTPTFDRHSARRSLLHRSDSGSPLANDSDSAVDLYASMDGRGGAAARRQPLASPYRDMPLSRRGSRKYLPGAFTASQGDLTADQSVVSLQESTGDRLPLSSDYHTQVFLGDSVDDAHQATERDWDEKPLKLQNAVSLRAFLNLSVLSVLALALLMLFLGYPLLSVSRTLKANRARNRVMNKDETGAVLGDFNQYPIRKDLVDPDTPLEAHTRLNMRTGKKMRLVFSDEFNKDGRSFYPGDDPFFRAENLHYWQTENYEWYHPQAITTRDGNLRITLSQQREHNLNFRGGMMSSWNMFCFRGGYIEANVSLPGKRNVSGLWPAIWTMGNLGRAGYGASTEGLWPYSHDNCDVGTLANQTYLPSQGGGPIAAESSGEWTSDHGPQLSQLPGQRLSRCTCLNSKDHPGPRHEDGTWVGRSAPEIDIFEAAGNNGEDEHGQVSQSLQVAPFDDAYNITRAPNAYINHRENGTVMNTYRGSPYQQAVSFKTNTTDDAYQDQGGKFDQYGFEYQPGIGPDAYITWTVSQKPTVTITAGALAANPRTEIGQREIPTEPMYIVINLGIASSFSYVSWPNLTWPSVMLVDYVRVWQDEDKIDLTCDPPDRPTAAYIKKHAEAYWNANLTKWLPAEKGSYNQPFPKNRLIDQC